MKKSYIYYIFLILLWAMPTFATGTGHIYIPASAFTCGQVSNCEKADYYTEFTEGYNTPFIKFTDSDSGRYAYARFWFPASHVTDTNTFSYTLFDIQMTSGSKKYCWGVGIGITPENAKAASFVASSPTEAFANHTTSGASTGSISNMTVENAIAYNYATSAACSTATNTCWGAPGWIFVWRKDNADVDCDTSTTDAQGFWGIDVRYSTP